MNVDCILCTLKNDSLELLIHPKTTQVLFSTHFQMGYKGTQLTLTSLLTMATVVDGTRIGCKVLILDGHKYQKNKVTRDRIYWRCWKKECRVSLITDLFNLEEQDPPIEILDRNQHNHLSVDSLIETTSIKNQMVNQIRRDVTKPVKRVYNDIVENDDTNPNAVPVYNSIRSQLSRVRSKMLPNIPNNVDDVVIPHEFSTSWNGENFLSHQDNDWGILIFATDTNFDKLKRCRTIYIDGTFKTTPHPYVQFATIHGDYHGYVIPLVMCLLTGKTIGHYRQMLQHVKLMVRRVTHHRWSPRVVVSDFELSLLIAVETELPRARRCCCYFHFCQSLYRRIQQLGLTMEYRNNDRVKEFLQKLMSLGYLPLPLVRQNFHLFITSRRSVRLMDRYPALREFINYIEANYFNGQFLPETWNVFNRDDQSRTNNHVEGFHSMWNRKIGVRHPSIWLFIRRLKDEQKQTDVKILAVERADPPPPQKRKWRQFNERLRRLKESYNVGDRTLNEYWEAVKHIIHNFVH